MKPSSQTKINYKRDKNKVEISGAPSDVKLPIWFDLISTKVLWLAPLTYLIFKMPEVSWLPVILQWMKRQMPFFVLFVMVETQLSG